MRGEDDDSQGHPPVQSETLYEAAFAAFDEEDRRLEDLRNSRLISRQKLLNEMDQFKDRKRRTLIKKTFQAHYQTARQRLNLPARDVKQMQVTSRPDYSGSAGPREILAYYAAIWWTSREDFGSPFSVPIVVDCPMQSGQDAKNLPAMIEFVSTGLPQEAQIYMTYEADVEQEFDLRIPLGVEYSLLSKEQLEPLAAEVLPKLQMMQKYLLDKQTAESR